MPKLMDLTGRTFGQLLVLYRDGSYRNKALWLCLCSCGVFRLARADFLVQGAVRSCGDRGRHPAKKPVRGVISSYNEAHQNVLRRRGRAADRPCARCGRPAWDWAYRGGSALERITEGGRRWSPDPDDYVPACRRCHRRYGVQQIQIPETRAS